MVILSGYSFTIMSMKIKARAYKESNYERYPFEIMAWREVTDIPKKKQGIAIALSLPEETECSIREKIFDELSIAQLEADVGFETFIEFFDEKLKKEDIADGWDKFNDFENLRGLIQWILKIMFLHLIKNIKSLRN